MPKQVKQVKQVKQGVNRVGPMDRADAARRLALADMSADEVTRALAAADRSVEPVTDGLSPHVADVYSGMFGYTIAWQRGLIRA